MMQTKGSIDDDRLLLLDPYGQGDDIAYSRPRCKVAIEQGVTNQLKKWPSYVSCAFGAACLVIGFLILFVVLVAFYLPTAIDDRCRELPAGHNASSLSIYFVKHDNHTWSAQDYCYIEAAARQNPELNVHLINVLDGKTSEDRIRAFFLRLREVERVTGYSLLGASNKEAESSKTPHEAQLRELLATTNPNIRNLDINSRQVFKNTKLCKAVPTMSEETLVAATKAYFLWNFPGIALNPRMHCNIQHVKELLYSGREGTFPDTLATIDPANDLQATAVPCQVFVGFHIHRMSEASKMNSPGEYYSLQETLMQFCPKIDECPEIRVIRAVPTCVLDVLMCPTVYSKQMPSLWDSKGAIITR